MFQGLLSCLGCPWRGVGGSLGVGVKHEILLKSRQFVLDFSTVFFFQSVQISKNKISNNLIHSFDLREFQSDKIYKI